MKRYAIGLLALVCLSQAFASETLLRLETRPDVTVPVYYMKQPNAPATVVLLPGGAGGLGQIIDGKPTSKNFLIRSRDHFANAGLNVAVMGRPSDKTELDYSDRISKEHLADIQVVVSHLKKDSGAPVWLVGTSRGTVSATAAAIAFQNQLAGIVLTSSVVSYKKIGAVPSQNLASIRIPVLVVHHDNDSCKFCAPHEVPGILRGLDNAPVKKLIMVSKDGNPQGDPCEPLHYHGFIDAEMATVKRITDWIKKPTP